MVDRVVLVHRHSKLGLEPRRRVCGVLEANPQFPHSLKDVHEAAAHDSSG